MSALPDIPLDMLRQHLPAQRWYAGTEAPETVDVVHAEVLRDGWPRMVRFLLAADESCYQVIIGLRPESDQLDFLRGHEEAALGPLDIDSERAIAYDATLDPELGMVLYERIASGQEPMSRVRPAGVEQSNTSLVYDERLILKLFRRTQPGANREVEVTSALELAGFQWIAAPLATETVSTNSVQRYDLALLQPFLTGGVDGWALALTSLRDLFGVYDTQSVPAIDLEGLPPQAADPTEAGGDFSAEAKRLGETTAAMHVAMTQAFGTVGGDAGAWADDIEAQARRTLDDVVPALAILDDLRAADPGPAMRIHGDYHLGQVMRTDSGWYVLDFEGEPDRPVQERQQATSPLRDVAGMVRSLHYASAVALVERGEDDFAETAEAWEAQNREAFLAGYMSTAVEGGILPSDERSVGAVLAAFELEKAVYELNYERAHRPSWEHIPRTALGRLGAAR